MVTDFDALDKIMKPLASKIVSNAALDRAKRVDHALDDFGNIRPDALNLLGIFLMGSNLDDAIYSTSSTVTYTDGASMTISLSSGIWTVMYDVAARGGNDAASSINFRVRFNGISSPIVTRAGASTAAAPFFVSEVYSNLEGDQSIPVEVQFKSNSTGLSSITDTVMKYWAIRTG